MHHYVRMNALGTCHRFNITVDPLGIVYPIVTQAVLAQHRILLSINHAVPTSILIILRESVWNAKRRGSIPSEQFLNHGVDIR